MFLVDLSAPRRATSFNCFNATEIFDISDPVKSFFLRCLSLSFIALRVVSDTRMISSSIAKHRALEVSTFSSAVTAFSLAS